MDLKQRLRNRELTIGTWQTLGHPAISEIMARAGFDWVTIDLEHSVISLREAEDAIRILQLSGLAALVRLTFNDSNQIKRVMDAGATGIIVPMVNSAQLAEEAVKAVYYPPRGKRGVGLARAQGYGDAFQPYLDWQRNGPVVVVQIEHIQAVENLESIFSVEGVDGYIIGPYDLSASMGIPGEFEHHDFLAAMARVKQVSHDMDILGGIHIIEPDPTQLGQRVQEGYLFIAYSLDIRMLDSACKIGVKHVREEMK